VSAGCAAVPYQLVVQLNDIGCAAIWCQLFVQLCGVSWLCSYMVSFV